MPSMEEKREKALSDIKDHYRREREEGRRTSARSLQGAITRYENAGGSLMDVLELAGEQSRWFDERRVEVLRAQKRNFELTIEQSRDPEEIEFFNHRLERVERTLTQYDHLKD